MLSLQEVLSLLDQGDQQKRRAATAMNERSSRAHSLFILSLRQSRPAPGFAAEGEVRCYLTSSPQAW